MEYLHACLQRVCIHTEATRLPMTALVTQLELVFGALMMISVIIALIMMAHEASSLVSVAL